MRAKSAKPKRHSGASSWTNTAFCSCSENPALAGFFIWALAERRMKVGLCAINNGANFQGVTDKTIARKYEYALSQFLKQR
jgi:hypothetical protein